MNKTSKLILACTCGALALLLIISGVLLMTSNSGSKPNTPGTPGGTIETPVQKNSDPLISQDEFLNPAKKYRALRIAHGFDDNTLPGKDTAERVQKLLDFGFGGVITNDGWDAQYLTNERKLERLNRFVQEAHAQGLRVWLYDERGYPSGTAGDLVVSANPDHRAIMLEQVTVTGSGIAAQSVAVPEDFISIEKAFITENTAAGSWENLAVENKNGRLTFTGTPGRWTAYIYCIVAYPENPEGGYNKTYPNLLNAEAVKEFINVTYETYKNSITDFSNIIEAFFDDEPQLCGTRNLFSSTHKNPVVPYDYGMFEDFASKYGYDLKEVLPMLFSGSSAEAKRVRCNFYDYIGTLLSQNFFGQIEKWCEENGTRLSGHMLLEEQMMYHIPVYGNFMLCAQQVGYPGFDILNPRPAQYINGISTGGKYASSVAWLYNKDRVFVEICPVNNPDEFAENHLDYALGTMTFAYFDGGNQIATYYTQANTEQDTGIAFNEYVGRLGSIVTEAQNKNQIAVYYSIDTVAANYIPPDDQSVYSIDDMIKITDRTVDEIVLSLRENGLDYVFLDDNAIAQGQVNGDALTVNNFTFKTIIVPRAEIIDAATMRVFDQLIQNGANIIFMYSVPQLAAKESDQAEVEQLAKKFSDNLCMRIETLPERITTTVPLTVKSSQTIYVSPYERNGSEFYFLANASEENASVTLQYEGISKYRLYNPVDGSITILEGNTCSIPSYRALFVQPIFE